jgi:hypothetical protein
MHDNFTAAAESLSPLVQEITSQVESVPEVLREVAITDKEEVEDISMPLSEKGKRTGERSSGPSWWAVASFLADPCAVLRSVLPTEALIPSQADDNSLEVWRQRVFMVRSHILMVSFFPALEHI